MKIDDGRSIGNPATSDEVDELLRSRMKILGLDCANAQSVGGPLEPEPANDRRTLAYRPAM